MSTDQLAGPASAVLDDYRRDGFIVVHQAVDPEGVEAILRDATEVCRGHHGPIGGAGDVDPDLPDDELLRRFLAIHMPHKISPVMRAALSEPRIVEALTTVIGPNVKAMQSMLFLKAPGMPGQAWHQDEYFIPTRDRSLTGVWIALDDATIDNGCLWAIPGSHRPGVVYRLEPHGDDRFDFAPQAVGFPHGDDDAVPVEVPAGAAIVFNGYLLHRSLPNRSPTSYRRALVNHYMSAESLLPWYGAGQGGSFDQDHRDIVMVAGEDPYAYKGITDVVVPHVRPRPE